MDAHPAAQLQSIRVLTDENENVYCTDDEYEEEQQLGYLLLPRSPVFTNVGWMSPRDCNITCKLFISMMRGRLSYDNAVLAAKHLERISPQGAVSLRTPRSTNNVSGYG